MGHILDSNYTTTVRPLTSREFLSRTVDDRMDHGTRFKGSTQDLVLDASHSYPKI